MAVTSVTVAAAAARLRELTARGALRRRRQWLSTVARCCAPGPLPAPAVGGDTRPRPQPAIGAAARGRLTFYRSSYLKKKKKPYIRNGNGRADDPAGSYAHRTATDADAAAVAAVDCAAAVASAAAAA